MTFRWKDALGNPGGRDLTAAAFPARPQAGTYRLIEMSRACSRVFATS
jgi:hypothetical protein